jgi:hypothetical protein
MDKGVEASRKADQLQQRAAAVGTAGMSSDDPDAAEKLKAKLVKLEETVARMKSANVACGVRIMMPSWRWALAMRCGRRAMCWGSRSLPLHIGWWTTARPSILKRPSSKMRRAAKSAAHDRLQIRVRGKATPGHLYEKFDDVCRIAAQAIGYEGADFSSGTSTR